MRLPLSRRMFLRGGAGAAIALPLFESFRPLGGGRTAIAATDKPKKIVFYVQSSQIYGPDFWPFPRGTAYDVQTMPLPRFPGSHPESYLPKSAKKNSDKLLVPALSDRDYQLPEGLASLAPHRKEMIILEGFRGTERDHNNYHMMLTGNKGKADNGEGGPSIDQLIAAGIGGATRFASLQVGVLNDGRNNGSWVEKVSWYDKGKGAPATHSPKVLFDKLFSDLETNPAEAENLLADQKSVLDAALGQYESLRLRLNPDDQAKLEQYAEAIRSVETGLMKMGVVGCMKPAQPTLAEPATYNGEQDIAALRLYDKLQSQLLAMALSCDLTRVATYQFLSEAAGIELPAFDIHSSWHWMSHLRAPADWDSAGSLTTWQNAPEEGLPNARKLIRGSRFVVEQLSQFISTMKEAGALDNTVVVSLAGMAHGGWHHYDNLPMLLFGNVGERLRGHGTHTRFQWIPDASDPTQRETSDPYKGQDPGHFVNDLFTTLAQAMDVPLTAIGTPAFNKGLLTELLKA